MLNFSLTKGRFSHFLIKKHVSLFGRVVVTDKFGLTYHLWKDTRVDSTIQRGCRTDDLAVVEWIRKLLARQTNNRKVAIDAGAYIGVMTLAMRSSLSDADIVYSFEPATKNFERLCSNINLNGWTNIQPVNAALSDSEIKVPFYFDGGQSRIDPEGTDEVSTVILEKFLQSNNHEFVDLLKVDAEGHDLQVLTGCGELLKKQKVESIIFERLLDARALTQTFEMLKQNGYVSYYIARNDGRLFQDLQKYPRELKPPLNILAISKETKDWLDANSLSPGK